MEAKIEIAQSNLEFYLYKKNIVNQIIAMARKRKLTPEVTKKFVKGLRLGLKVEDVCAVAGISTQTFYNWMNKAQAGGGKPYIDFFEAVKKAEPASKAARVKAILAAAKGGQETTERKVVSRKSPTGETEIIEQTVIVRKAPPQWQAAAWWLERRYAAEFGRRDRVENLNVDFSRLSEEQLERIANGEPIAAVLASAGESGAGTPAPAE